MVGPPGVERLGESWDVGFQQITNAQRCCPLTRHTAVARTGAIPGVGIDEQVGIHNPPVTRISLALASEFPQNGLDHGVGHPIRLCARYKHLSTGGQGRWSPRSRSHCDPFPRNGLEARDEGSRPQGL